MPMEIPRCKPAKKCASCYVFTMSYVIEVVTKRILCTSCFFRKTHREGEQTSYDLHPHNGYDVKPH